MIESSSLLRWAQFSEPTFSRIDVQRPQQGSDVDGTDDLVAGQPVDRLRDLVTQKRGDLTRFDIDGGQVTAADRERNALPATAPRAAGASQGETTRS